MLKFKNWIKGYGNRKMNKKKNVCMKYYRASK